MDSYQPYHSLLTDIIGYNSGENIKSLKFECDPYYDNSLTPITSDVHFPMDDFSQGSVAATDGSLDFAVGGEKLQLPQDLENMVNTLLQEPDPFRLGEHDPENSLLDLEIGAASLWLDDDPDTLNLDTMNSDLVGSNTGRGHPAAAGPRLPDARRRRSKTKRSQRSSNATLELPTAHHPTADAHLLPYPPLEELGVASPALDSDAGSSTSSDAGARPHRRRPRVSYSTLTEEERYHRIRDLNNEASRLYRERHRHQFSKKQEEERFLLERNAVLQARAAGLEELRDRTKEFCHTFLRQHLRHPQ